jgi:hypothetical protein
VSSTLDAFNAFRAAMEPYYVCATCGTDPKDDLYPHVGLLCHWCDELKNIREAQKWTETQTTIERIRAKAAAGPMRTRRTASTGPRRALPIPNMRIRQHHRRNWENIVVSIMLYVYMAFVIVFFGLMQR